MTEKEIEKFLAAVKKGLVKKFAVIDNLDSTAKEKRAAKKFIYEMLCFAHFWRNKNG